MKNGAHILKLCILLCFCIIVMPSLKAHAEEAEREAYYYYWYGGIINANNEVLESITVHEGETLLVSYAYIDIDEGIVRPNEISSFSSAYYDWIITTGTEMDEAQLVYSNENASVWSPSVATSNYTYIKGIEATDNSDNYYLTLYYDSTYLEEPRIYASIPITVLPAESGVNYTDYGVESPSDLCETSEELLAEMRKTFLNHQSSEVSFYTTRTVAEALCDEEYKIYNQYLFDSYYIFDFYTNQGGITAKEGDYLQQNYYGRTSYSVNISESNYRGEVLSLITLDTSSTSYVTTLQQESLFENKLAALFANGGELEYTKNLSDYDKVVACMNYINSHVSYVSTTEALRHTAYSALCENKATCQGYALLFYRMLRELGIENRILMGVDVAAHTYNLVWLNGKYYYCDVGANAVLRGSNNFEHAELQEHYLTEKFQVAILNKISTTDYDPASSSNNLDYTSVFDAQYYYNNNGDLALALGFDENALLNHFINSGMAEGRQGSAEFNLSAYKELNSDLVSALGSDNKSYYVHYIQFGKAEGRPAVYPSVPSVDESLDYSAVFDVEFYCAYNGDVASVLGYDETVLLEHFVNYGMAEGRRGSEEFDLNAYKELNSDLVTALGDDNKGYYVHYIKYGKAEGRQASKTSTVDMNLDYSAVFDVDYYYNANSDLADVLGYDETALLNHFVNYGMAEGRRGSEEFDLNAYKELNSDLVDALGEDCKSYYIHYIQYGKAEGRPAVYQSTPSVDESLDYSAVFEVEFYCTYNGDVASVLGYDETVLLEHFVNYGMAEGRQGSEEFNLGLYKALNSDLVSAFGDDNKSYYIHYIQYGKAEGRVGR